MWIDWESFKAEIARAIKQNTGQQTGILEMRPLGGGCINEATEVVTTTGSFFLKYHHNPLPDMFGREAEGLLALYSAGAIEVPHPLFASSGWEGVPSYLLTTYLKPGRQTSDFMERFGRAFATLHDRTRQERCGFENDNYIGSTPQPNGWADDWVAFFREKRLGFQLRLAERNGHRGDLQRLGGKLLDRLDELIGVPDEPACLLHGDLWSGNYMCTAEGEPAIIDPAAYYGHREADLAMTHLFGGFSPRFYSAYEEVWPLPAGSSDRQEIYKLYHLLNHLNLFGGSYLSGCIGILRRYAK